MDALIRERGVVKGKLTSASKFFDDPDKQQSATLSILNKRLEKLNEIWYDFDKIQTQIQTQCSEQEDEIQQTERDDFETKFFIVEGKCQELILKINKMSIHTSSSQTVHEPSKVKLPKLDLPIFSGNYADWDSFYDLFCVLVHDNVSLGDVQKLQYLKSSLRGEAYRLIQAIQVTEANYSEAWKLLKERYDNKRRIIAAHYQALLQQKSLNKDSAKGLRQLLDIYLEHMRSLAVLKADTWDTIMVHLLSERLDSETRKLWEMSIVTSNSPSFDELKLFVQQRCQALETTEPPCKEKATHNLPCVSSNAKSKFTSAFYVSTEACVICKAFHPIHQCDRFLKASPQERSSMAKYHQLCFNCLRRGHSIQRCQSGTCKKCGKKHNTLLHFVQPTTSPTDQAKEVIKTVPVVETPVVSTHISENSMLPQVLLSTCIVNVHTNHGTYPYRALLDCGSQCNFITSRVVKQLNLKQRKQKVLVHGIGSSGTTQSCGLVNIQIQSKTTSFNTNIAAVVLPKITSVLPSRPVDSSSWIHLENIKLADPNYHKPDEVDLLLGAPIFSQVLRHGKIMGDQDQPTAHNTEFGWVISGSCGKAEEMPIVSNLSVTIFDTDNLLKKFWEIEEPQSTTTHYSLEEKRCEEIFKSTTTRDVDGRYIVELPFKNEVGPLGESKTQAQSRFKQVEKKFERQPALKGEYTKFMNEYLSLGHMEPILESCAKPDYETFYLPHHCVIKEGSSSTKLRVVFDASAISSTGISLNEMLMAGPTVQQDLMSILLRFRKHRVVFTADITKMYRQIKVHPKHQDFQRILWRNSNEEPIQEFKLNTVTYGTKSAPYLATRTLNQLAHDERARFPIASQVLTDDCYVDDCMTGTYTIKEALLIQKQLIDLLKCGGLEWHKWASNVPELLTSICEDKIEKKCLLDPGSNDEAIKTLGIGWIPDSDLFYFHISTTPETICSKRTILSEIARLFDPLGWISPVVITAKILLQHLWLLGLSWDSMVPENIVMRWQRFKNQLPNLRNLRIQRYLETSDDRMVELHGFCDSSEAAYAAVIYTRTYSRNGEIAINILCSKTKVAPIKKVSIPRLELCAALLLARLMKTCIRALQVNNISVTAWSDSTVTLCWIRGHPNRWKTFVANRVSEIQDLIPPDRWNFIGTKENPADCASKGLHPEEIINHPLWWKGPNWLLTSCESDRVTNSEEDPEVLREEKTVKVECLTILKNNEFINQFSKLSKLIRITAYILRFIHNCKQACENRKRGFLTTDELENSLHVWIKIAQNECFAMEINALSRQEEVLSGSRLKSLNPFLDSCGLLRVGGRIENSNLRFNKKHPLILPKQHRLTQLIITQEHLKLLHASQTLLLSSLRERFWILNARSVVRQVLHKCMACFRQRKSVNSQLMGQLPSPRIQPSRPFQHCGVDYAGPFLIRATTGRGRIRKEKCYAALFICFSTKAIHIELVTDLSTESFIAALRRFVARRGKCSDMYSDCGTNFIGANRELKELAQLVKSESYNQQVGTHLASEQIKWHFNPPSAPHCGGVWEAGIKSAKYHLRRIVGNSALTFEQLYTIFTQIEACLNSRPLCQLSSDPTDLSALTPGHFLIGDSLVSVPDSSVCDKKESSLSKWRLLQKMVQDFWRRWTNEYLTTLQQRTKWTNEQPNLQPGDLVLIKDQLTYPLHWKLARVTTVHPGKDNLVRTVTLKTSTGMLKRPVSKLCVLPEQ